MRPTTKAAKYDEASHLRQWFPMALKVFTQFTSFVSMLDSTPLQGFSGRHAESQLIVYGNFLIYLFLLAKGLDEISEAYRHLEEFQESLQRLRSTPCPKARLLLKPVSLRIDSFVSEAVRLMRKPTNS
ncbi:putative Zn(2)-C6 fungal-type domain-containing protein [Seiridium unicorne]|uniref:Zn(2)-C6 fungal-type domain-containing protein n=1 Tax=Seiridium unicorne TaxID=138068 RepID=A0ABR2URS5_9PEZI